MNETHEHPAWEVLMWQGQYKVCRFATLDGYLIGDRQRAYDLRDELNAVAAQTERIEALTRTLNTIAEMAATQSSGFAGVIRGTALASLRQGQPASGTNPESR